MKKNSTLQQKLKSYSAVAAGAAAATALSNDAKAQVIYTDVSPDVTVNTSGDNYQLDLDNNGVVDFGIAFMTGTYAGTYPYNYIVAYAGALASTNQIDTAATSGYPTAHASGDLISAANLWDIGYGAAGQHLIGITFTTAGFTAGNFPGTTDKYLAVKFDISGTTHYGWARLDVGTNSETFTIKDYAYNGTADAPITAGDMGTATGIVSNKLQGVKVYTNSKQLNVNLGETASANVMVTGMTGQEVYKATQNSSFSQIDLSGVANGIYNVTVTTTDGRVFTKKVSL